MLPGRLVTTLPQSVLGAVFADSVGVIQQLLECLELFFSICNVYDVGARKLAICHHLSYKLLTFRGRCQRTELPSRMGVEAGTIEKLDAALAYNVQIETSQRLQKPNEAHKVGQGEGDALLRLDKYATGIEPEPLDLYFLDIPTVVAPDERQPRLDLVACWIGVLEFNRSRSSAIVSRYNGEVLALPISKSMRIEVIETMVIYDLCFCWWVRV